MVRPQWDKVVNSRLLAQLGSKAAISRDSKEEEEGGVEAEIGDTFDGAARMIDIYDSHSCSTEVVPGTGSILGRNFCTILFWLVPHAMRFTDKGWCCMIDVERQWFQSYYKGNEQ